MSFATGKSLGGIDSALRWIGDLDHPFYNDERQRFVWYEASAIGFQLLLLLQLTAGPLAALFTSGSDAKVLMLISAPALLGALVTVGYSASKGAPYVGSRSDLRRPRTYLLVIPAVFFAVVVSGLGARGSEGVASPSSSGIPWMIAGVLIGAFVLGLVVGTLLNENNEEVRYEVASPRPQVNAGMSRLDRSLRWVADLDHPFLNEERQRFVWYEASAIGFQLILVLQLAVSSIAILVLGQDSLPGVLIGIAPSLIVAVVVTAYAQRKGAQYFPKLSDAKRTRGLLGFVLLALYFAAMVRLGLDAPQDADGFAGGFTRGMPVGFAVGIAAVGVGMWRNTRREAKSDLEEI